MPSDLSSADNLDRLDTLARIGASLLGVQLEAADVALSDVAVEPWRFGYCFGLFEAMARYARLDQYTEGMRMMGAGFGKLVGDGAQGMALFRRALELQDNQQFIEGAQFGETDLLAWAQDANALPAGLTRHLRRKPDAV
jgi:hypothetical protein